MGAVVQCDYDGLDALDINEAILNHNVVEVYGSEVGGTTYCSIAESIVGRRDVRVDFHGAIVKALADVPAIEMKYGFSVENAILNTAQVEGYVGPAVAFTGEFAAARPTNMENVVVQGGSSGTGVALIGDRAGATRKITHTYLKGVHIHNYEVGLLMRDVDSESNEDYLNANFYQGRISGSLRAIELDHANGNDITVDFQPSADSLSGIRCHACSHNRISGMFWDSQQVAEKVLQFDVDSHDNRVGTPLHSSYVQDDGTGNIIQ